MRVLVVTNQYPTDAAPGEAPCIQDQVDALRESGINVDLMVIDSAKSPWSYLGAAFKFFCSNFGPRRFDVIHGFYGYSGLAARFQWRVPILLTYRGSDLLGGVDGKIGRWVAPKVDAIITMTEEMKAAAGREDCAVIPFGVRVDLYPRDARSALREQLGFGDDERIVLFPYDPARAVKRFDRIEAAVAASKATYPGIRIVAMHSASPEVLAQHMVSADLMLLTSDYEGSPLAVREAMAACLPIVSVDVGDVRALIEGLDHCYVVDAPQDAGTEPALIEALAAGIQKSLAGGQRSNGLERIEARDSRWSAQRVLDIYRRLAPQA